MDSLPRPKLTKPLFNAPFKIGGDSEPGKGGDVPEWVLQRVDDVIMEHFFKVQHALEKVSSRLDEHAEQQGALQGKIDEALTQVASLMHSQTADWATVRERDRELKAIKEIVYGRNAQLDVVNLADMVKRHEEEVKELKRRLATSAGKVGAAPSKTDRHGLSDPTDPDTFASPSGEFQGNETVMNMLVKRVAIQQHKLLQQEVKCNIYALKTHDFGDDDRQEEMRRLNAHDQRLSREGEQYVEHHDRPLTVFAKLATQEI